MIGRKTESRLQLAFTDALFIAAYYLRIPTGYRETLRMCIDLDCSPPVQVCPLAPQYNSRVAHSSQDVGDAELADYAGLLKLAGFDTASPEMVKTEIVNESLRGLAMVRDATKLVAAAAVVDEPGTSDSLLLTFVAVSPQHRGQKLGEYITIAAIGVAQNANVRRLVLRTEDNRIPAIALYLKCGFSPCLSSWDRSHRTRWARALGKLCPQRAAMHLSNCGCN